MIIHDVKQGSQAWLQLRAGIPTASAFDSIVTPKGKPSESQRKYMYLLISERMLGKPSIKSVSAWMERGSATEAEAVSYYEFQRGSSTYPVGFITNDAGTIGASPDRLITDDTDGMVEIKVPSPEIHVGYLLGQKTVAETYKVQIQGQLWIAEKKWVDIVSYHPEMPEALVRVGRDDKFIEILSKSVEAFSQHLEYEVAQLVEDGVIKVHESMPQPPPVAMFYDFRSN